MKKMLAVLSALTMSASLCLSAVPAIAESNADTIIDVLTNNFSVWNDLIAESTDYTTISFLDVDFDGELELVVSSYGGSGLYTYVDFFKVIDDQIVALDIIDPGEGFFDIVGESESVKLYRNADGVMEYYSTDYFRAGISISSSTFGSFAYDAEADGIINRFYYEAEVLDQGEEYHYFDCSTHNEITAEEYYQLEADTLAGLTDLNLTYQFVELDDTATTAEVKQALTEAYQAFSYDGFENEVPVEPGLTEDELKEIINAYGDVTSWEYHDYDGDGTNEAFALITRGEGEYDQFPSLYFINADGEVTTICEDYGLFYYEGTAAYSQTFDGKGFFSFDITAFGSSWQTPLYSVKDGVPYELDISRELQGFFYDEAKDVFYTTVNEFLPEGGHLYPEYILNYDSETQQFSISDLLLEDYQAPAKPVLDYDQLYYDYVYNVLVPQYGIAARNVSPFTPDYNIDNLSGLVSSAVYDFGQDGVKELVVITREEESYNGVPSRTLFPDFWSATTTFYLNLYQADEDGNIELLDRMATPEYYTTSSSVAQSYHSVDISISGDAIYQEMNLESMYGSVGPSSDAKKYAVYDVVDGKFNPYVITVSQGAVYTTSKPETISPEMGLGDVILYYEPDESYYFDEISGIYSDLDELNAEINQQFADHHLNFTTAAVEHSVTEYYETLELNIDVVADVNLMHYAHDYDLESEGTYQTMSTVMVTNPKPAPPVVDNTDDDDDDDSSSGGTSSSSSTKSSSSSSSSGTSSTASPNTSDKLPAAAGFTALAALAAGFFTRRKNK